MNIKKQYEAYEKKNRVFLKADKETAVRLNIKVGDEYSVFPEPKNKDEAFERLQNYQGLIVLESLINNLKKSFPINKRVLEDKLELINSFISEAEKLNINDSITPVSPSHPLAKKYEYLKLKYDYYKNENLEYTGFYYFFSSLTILVYAEYFLFKDWLENKIKINSSLEKLLPELNIIQDSFRIDNVFVEELRLNISTTKFNFDSELDNIEIVPMVNTHDYLLNNFNIDKSILKYYYKPSRRLITEQEFENLTKFGYKGDIESVLKPYVVNIFGAFYARKNLNVQMMFLTSNNKYFINDVEVKYFSDLIPYFIKYSEGFKAGYNEFESKCINPFLNDYSDKTDFTYKVFEFVTNNLATVSRWLSYGNSFTTHSGENGNNNIICAFENGEIEGFFYKAWSLILANSYLYSELFKIRDKNIQNSHYELKEKKLINKKIPEKWYALLYWMQLNSKGMQPPRNSDGDFVKSEIMTTGRLFVKDSTGQNFYRKFIELANYLNDERMIIGMFSHDWKNKIIEMSNNDIEIITYFQVKYN